MRAGEQTRRIGRAIDLASGLLRLAPYAGRRVAYVVATSAPVLQLGFLLGFLLVLRLERLRWRRRFSVAKVTAAPRFQPV